jgi:hypothetical protein
MSILQDPNKALNQIEWYLDNKNLEKFPGAFILASGNLCRHLLEQLLFILAFYSGMPQSKYIKTNHQLRTVDAMLKALREKSPISNRTYFEEARLRGPRIRKFASFPRSLDKWRKEFNAPSHFHNPAAQQNTREVQIRDFIQKMRKLFDHEDEFLIIAAVNEIRSKGKIKAILSNDSKNTPGIQVKLVVTPKDLVIEKGSLSLKSQSFPIQVIPDDKEVPYRWSSRVVLIQNSYGMNVVSQLITEDGYPIDLTNFNTILLSLARTSEGKKRLERRLMKLKVKIQWEKKSA